jgi:hypothetical protein
MSAISNRIEFVLRSIAATRLMVTASPRAQPRADLGERLAAERVRVRHGELARDERMQALDPVGHPACGLRAAGNGSMPAAIAADSRRAG